MSLTNNIVTSLITGSLGATIGGIAVALIQVVSKHSESRATAANLVADFQSDEIKRLQTENKSIKEAVFLVTDVLDAILSDLQEHPELRTKLNEVNQILKTAF